MLAIVELAQLPEEAKYLCKVLLKIFVFSFIRL